MNTLQLVRGAADAPGIFTITLDRPPVHPMSFPLMRELKAAFDAVPDETAVVVVTASGFRAFCAGADLNERLSPPEASERAAFWLEVLSTVRNSAVPVVALINGPCLGAGLGLATQCDLRLAVDSATFGLPEINVGRAGGGAHLRRFVREGTVRTMSLTGASLTASQAFDAGFVEGVFARSEWPQAPMKLVSEIAQKGRSVLRFIKYVLDRGEEAGLLGGIPLESVLAERLRRFGIHDERIYQTDATANEAG